MRTTRRLSVGVLVLALGLGSQPLAQGPKSLPKGRPFQMLAQQIAETDAGLAKQIADLQARLAALEGRVDAVEQVNATQGQLIEALQAAIYLLEGRMATADNRLGVLETWNASLDALVNVLNGRIEGLKTRIDEQGASLESLFALHNAQQVLIGELQGAIDLLKADSTGQDGRITSLQAQLAIVQDDYSDTRSQLAAGCPASSSIRLVVPRGAVVCEPDNSALSLVTAVNAAGSSASPGQFGAAFAVCPAVVPGVPEFVATGGGFSVVQPVGAQVLASFRASANSWQVIVRNTNAIGGPIVSFQAAVTCVRPNQ